jgi:glycosyltransferase involved in cell wall biosynthesis
VRIGILSPVAGFQGGIERLSFELARGLRGRGHRVVLLPGGRPGLDPGRFQGAFDAFQPGEPLDVVLAQKALDLEALDAAGDAPVVLAAHDHDHTCPRAHRYLPLTKEPCHRAPGVGCALRGCLLVRRSGGCLPFGLADLWALLDDLRRLALRGGFLACSDYIGARLQDAGVPASRIRVARPCPAEDDAPLLPRPTAPRLLFVGQLLRGKGVAHAIDALRWLPGAHLTVVGDGPSRQELEAQARRVAPGRVTFEGFVPAEQVHRHYDRASVVLVPSHWPEPFGMIGVEAMRRGRPVIGADHGGIPEWLTDGEGGFKFTPGDPRALAAAAGRALAETGRGGRARAAAQARFSHERYLAQVEEALASAAGGRGA